MENKNELEYTAFEDQRIIASGTLDKVALKVKKRLKTGESGTILIFSNATGKQMDFNLSGTEDEIKKSLAIYMASGVKLNDSSGPGRPKLGVIAREISLLPKHWEWLATQSGGASATIRRLVEEAKKSTKGKQLIQDSQERTYKVMFSLAGNLPGYEEALRSLYVKDKKTFFKIIKEWPDDFIEYFKLLSKDVWTHN